MSKGSTPRPFSVSQAEYESRWDAIFQRDLPEVKPTKMVPNRIADARKMVRPQNCGTGYCSCIECLFPTVNESLTVPRSLIEGIMSTETCGYPFCQCVDVCKEAK